MYYTYMLRCLDNLIYTGMTNNLEKRINQHVLKEKSGANLASSQANLQKFMRQLILSF